ncbi:MAG TPA: protein arginine kinase [Gemmatimonadales bacterium]|nr:protein arginine kinase [Gemmatimonadales bacterium]
MTFDLRLIPDGGIGWADASGPEGHIVLSSRIRLARNLQGMPFTIRADPDEHEVVLAHVTAVARETPELADAALVRIDMLERTERQLLHERHLISRELAGLDPSGAVRRGAALMVSGDLAVMINEEDHLRLQSLRSGFALPEAYAALERLDTQLGQRLAFAFHPEFGYLTSCPTNAGTGLRASVLIHLPGLVLTKEIAKVLQGLAQVGLTFRGLYGEGSEVVGNFFQLSNQTTLGKSEEDLLDQLVKIVRQVVEYEEEARRVLRRDAPALIEDKIWRAYGLLRHARLLSFEEGMNLLSGVRLGVGLNLIKDVGVYTLNKLMLFTQPAHLSHQYNRALTDPDLPALRAAFVRRLLEDDARRRGASDAGGESEAT